MLHGLTPSPTTCDPHGGCSAFKPAVYEYLNADPQTCAIGVNPTKIYP
jgi:hypothetical protein